MLKYIFMDIDGTLANGSHRKRYPEYPSYEDWSVEAQKDPPILQSLEPTWYLHKHCETFFYVTTRPEKAYVITKKWLATHNFPEASILMRPDDSTEASSDVKRALVAPYIQESKYRTLAIDNEDNNLAMYLNLGVAVLKGPLCWMTL